MDAAVPKRSVKTKETLYEEFQNSTVNSHCIYTLKITKEYQKQTETDRTFHLTLTALSDTIPSNLPYHQRIDPVRNDNHMYAYIKHLPTGCFLGTFKTHDTWTILGRSSDLHAAALHL